MSQPHDPTSYDDSPAYPAGSPVPPFDDTGQTGAIRITPPPPATAPTTLRTTRGPSRASSVLSSVVLSLVLTPLGLIALDYSIKEGWGRGITTSQDDRAPVAALVALGVGAVLLVIVGALSRMSGLGPLLAGLVWGAGPTVGFALVPGSTAQRMDDLPDPYDLFLSGLTAQSIVFAAVGALLIGAGLFGRWRRTKVVVAR